MNLKCAFYSEPHLNIQFALAAAIGTQASTYYTVAEVKKHELYKKSSRPEFSDYDIAVIRINGRFTFGSNVQPIPLATQAPPTGALAVLVGWGRTINVGSKLRAVSVPIVSQDKCRRFYINRDEGEVTPRMLCAGVLSGDFSTCAGDDGSPLVYNRAQVGVLFWEMGCGRADSPPVYANVAVFRDWIRKNTGV
ncbi:hypothetical protein R5R35_003262 [Gryllus longicercus]|uniref:Peptidase S1 domain-containing protein n=1 Tax=Gryllus longicercus TaxID=2509291 RepID=A0AAN9VQ26_9ORTH